MGLPGSQPVAGEQNRTALDYETLDVLRQNHPAWRLLVSPHAPLMVSFFHRAFFHDNVRVAPQADLVEALEYLNEGAAPYKGWLPGVRSLLMDESTLPGHRELWGRELGPGRRSWRGRRVRSNCFSRRCARSVRQTICVWSRSVVLSRAWVRRW